MSAPHVRLELEVQGYPALVRRAERVRTPRLLRPSEHVLLIYFAYMAVLASAWHLSGTLRAVAITIPSVLFALAYFETSRGTKATGVFREWISPALVLIAYQEVNWFARAQHDLAREHAWVFWDRLLL